MKNLLQESGAVLDTFRFWQFIWRMDCLLRRSRPREFPFGLLLDGLQGSGYRFSYVPVLAIYMTNGLPSAEPAGSIAFWTLV